MRVPDGATGVTVHYGDGDVYMESFACPRGTRAMWTVWDIRPVRQGARLVESGLSFRAAEALAKRLTAPPSGVKLENM